MRNFILKGDIAYSENKDKIETFEQGYLVCEEGICRGAFSQLPAEYGDFPVIDCSDSLVIPGMTDLHTHAPQYACRGFAMDLELLEWLNTYTFPQEARYADVEYAKRAYGKLVEDLRNSFTTRAVFFGTLHTEGTIVLMDMLEESGLVTFAGRVNMDRNGGQNLQEPSPQAALEDTAKWLDAIEGRYERTKPILTPRFIPSCSDELMRGLGRLAEERGLRIQSHLSENPLEIQWVKELVPASSCYANAYELFGCMGTPENPAIMAHCVYSDDRELEIMKQHGAFVAHCADSNMNLSSGIAPAARFLESGINMGLGSDIAGGTSLDMMAALVSSIKASKMYWRLVDQDSPVLTFEQAFWLATAGGGKYFGDVGTFKPGYEFDALVLDDSGVKSPAGLSVRDRLERLCYDSGKSRLVKKFVAGREIGFSSK
ncbi:MAG: amidohydrolase family protein [Emergencia sp.]